MNLFRAVVNRDESVRYPGLLQRLRSRLSRVDDKAAHVGKEAVRNCPFQSIVIG